MKDKSTSKFNNFGLSIDVFREMKTMDKITSQAVDQVVADLMSAVKEVAKKHGLDYKGVNSRYDQLSFSSSFKFALPPTAKAKQDSDVVSAQILGLPADIIGKTVRYGEHQAKIVGFNLNKPKFGVQAHLLDQGGKAVNLVTEQVVRLAQDPKNFIGEIGTSKPETKLFTQPQGRLLLKPNPLQSAYAAKNGINMADPNNLIILLPTGKNGEGEFIVHPMKNPIASYNNGMLKMLISGILKKQPAGAAVVNTNIPQSIL